MNEPSGSSRFSRIVDVLTLVAILLAIGLLVEQRLKSRAEHRRATSVVEDAYASAIPAGTRLRQISVSDSAGAQARLFEKELATSMLVYVFKTSCPVCEQQKPEWVELASVARQAEWQVNALTPESLVPWVRHYFPPIITTLKLEDPVQAGTVLGIRAVPTTILVDARGQVASYHVGRLSPEANDSIRHLLRQSGRLEER